MGAFNEVSNYSTGIKLGRPKFIVWDIIGGENYFKG